ncbi:MAG: hypothetical protein EOM77_03640 [Bacteroidia bacterium]|nr:hypothetical protein [Bacteroidia bacterium]
MKKYKLLSIVSFVGIGILGAAFVYNIVFALGVGIAPFLPVNVIIFFLPLIVGLFLVPYGLKSGNRQLIYIGNMVGLVSGAALSYQIARLCFTTTPGLLISAFSVWTLLVLAGSLTMMAYSKKADFRPIHDILSLIPLAGIGASLLTTLIVQIVLSIRFASGIPFGNYVSVGLAFVALAPVAFFVFVLRDEARLVKLEVPEYVRPVREPAKAKPVEEPKPKTSGKKANKAAAKPEVVKPEEVKPEESPKA